MHNITILLAALCILAFVGSSQAECCQRSMRLLYYVDRGSCSAAGGFIGHLGKCSITICANGKRLVGSYCGRGSCNIFGCNCDNGCITGYWERSFIKNYRRLGVRILEFAWNA